jgi:hypothetical protein
VLRRLIETALVIRMWLFAGLTRCWFPANETHRVELVRYLEIEEEGSFAALYLLSRFNFRCSEIVPNRRFSCGACYEHWKRHVRITLL